MSDDLRTRIAAAIYKGCDNRVSPGLCRQAADAVIRELGLRKASRPSDYGYVNYPPGDRYITDWLADE